jgi:uncharacterized protein YrrD
MLEIGYSNSVLFNTHCYFPCKDISSLVGSNILRIIESQQCMYPLMQPMNSMSCVDTKS